MICDPCKQGIHAGPVLNMVEQLPGGGMLITGTPVCKGGTWCDCQHRTDVNVAATMVAKKHAKLLEHLS